MVRRRFVSLFLSQHFDDWLRPTVKPRSTHVRLLRTINYGSPPVEKGALQHFVRVKLVAAPFHEASTSEHIFLFRSLLRAPRCRSFAMLLILGATACHTVLLEPHAGRACMFLDHLASESPDKPAYIMAGTGIKATYASLNLRTIKGAHLLRSAGLQQGDRVVLYSENNAAFLEVALACIRCGLYFVPAGRHLKEQELMYMLKDSGARMLVVSDLCSRTIALDRLPATIEHVYVTEATDERYPQWERAIESQPESNKDSSVLGTTMFYSSGTTGQPKGVFYPLTEKTTRAWSVPLTYEASDPLSNTYSSRNINLVTGPMYHISPFYAAVMALLLGGTAVIMERFDAEWALSLIQSHRVSHAYMVPTMFVRLLMLEDDVRRGYDISSLRHVEHGSAPCPVSIKEKMIEWFGPILFEVYGASEPAGRTSIYSADWLSHKGSVGRADFGTVHILDENHRELGPHEVGEIFFSGSDVPFEYFNAPEKKRSRSTNDGWFSYGDLGYVDSDGYLYLVDRKDNMIIVGGQKVYPLEVENELIAHEAVRDVAVIGLSDSVYGQRVHAYVQLRSAAAACTSLQENILSYCRIRLADYKCPTSLDFVDTLPRTEHGKLLKRYLKEKPAA